MNVVEWSNDCSIRLMEEYRKRPELWDSTHQFYRVQTAKYEAWSELADIFECDIADLRKKLNSLFASHRREKAKIKGGGISTWYLYPYMKFLPSHIDPDQSNTSAEVSAAQTNNDDTDTSNNEAMDDDSLQQEIIIKSEPVYAPKIIRKRIKYKPQRPKLLRTVRRKEVQETPSNSMDSKLVECLRLLRRSDKESARTKDDCDSFGEYIADSLRKHDDRTQSMIKQAINNILFEQEMKKYSSPQYSVIISSMEENPLILGEEPNK